MRSRTLDVLCGCFDEVEPMNATPAMRSTSNYDAGDDRAAADMGWC